MAIQQHRGELGHTLRSRHVTMIAFGGVIGAGLLIGASGAIRQGGPGVFLVYGACGLLVLLVMRMLGEMAVAQPGHGSFAGYSALALGPWAGFVMRWLYWYSWIFTVGAETVAGAKLLHQAGMPGPVWAVGLGLVVLMTLTNLTSVRTYGEFEFWFALLKVTAISAFIAIGVAVIAFFGPGPQHALHTLLGSGGLFPRGAGGLLAATPVVIFSMLGCEIATIAAAESADPAGNVARTVNSVAARIALFYVCSVLVITAILPWNTLVVGLSPFKSALDVIGIPGSSTAMLVIVLTAVLSCLNSALYVTSRMLYELGRSGQGPGFLQYTARNRTPTIGILVSCAAGSAAALAQFFLSQDVFTLLASSTGDLALFIYIIIAVAEIRQRRRLEAAGAPIPLKMWLFPWLSYAVIAAIVGILVLLAWIPQERLTLALSTLAVAVVFGAQRLHRRLRAVAAEPADCREIESTLR